MKDLWDKLRVSLLIYVLALAMMYIFISFAHLETDIREWMELDRILLLLLSLLITIVLKQMFKKIKNK